MENLVKLVGIIILIVLSLCYGAVIGGVIVSKFWGWFILPIFTTLPNITWIQGIGVSMFIGLFKYIDTNSKTIDEVEIKSKANWGLAILYSPIILLIGYLLHLIIK